LQFESEVEVQRNVPSLPFHPVALPLHVKYGAPAAGLLSLKITFTCPCNGRSGAMYPSSTMPSAACTQELLAVTEERLRTRAIKKDDFFTNLPISS